MICDCKKFRLDGEKKDLITRLNRIEGQIRGLKSMVDNDAYCVDILTQSAAAEGAIDAFNRRLLENHIRSCVADDIKNGSGDKIDELMNILQKLMK